VLCKNRDEVQRIMNANKIFPPVHWRLPEDVSSHLFPTSHQIAANILTIPIDQRYDKKDIDRVVDVLSVAVQDREANSLSSSQKPKERGDAGEHEGSSSHR